MELYSVHMDGKTYLIDAEDALAARKKVLAKTGLKEHNFQALYLLEDIRDGENPE